MRNLTIPCALLVLGAVVAACDAATPTESVETLALETLGCAQGFNIGSTQTKGVDRNGDGLTCVKILSQQQSGSYRQVEIDNSVPGGAGGCPGEFVLDKSGTYAGTGVDRNGDGLVCTKTTTSGTTVAIDNTAGAGGWRCSLAASPGDLPCSRATTARASTS